MISNVQLQTIIFSITEMKNHYLFSTADFKTINYFVDEALDFCREALYTNNISKEMIKNIFDSLHECITELDALNFDNSYEQKIFDVIRDNFWLIYYVLDKNSERHAAKELLFINLETLYTGEFDEDVSDKDCSDEDDSDEEFMDEDVSDEDCSDENDSDEECSETEDEEDEEKNDGPTDLSSSEDEIEVHHYVTRNKEDPRSSKKRKYN